MTIRALVTGITGQDGSYLAELLLSKGYEVHGILRPQRHNSQDRKPDYLEALLSRIHPHYADLGDAPSLYSICRDCEPDQIYHLGGPTRVDSNLSGSAVIFQLVFGSTKALLEAIADRPNVVFFLAGTAEMIGIPTSSPQSEMSARNPRSLYGFAKLAAADLVSRRRENFSAAASTGILFNHESPRREPFFLSRKVTRGLVRVSLGLQPHITLGNLDAVRDWGYAPDYVEAMWRVLASGKPGDYVIATGETHRVRDLVLAVCNILNLEFEKCVVQDRQLFRSAEPMTLCGDYSKLREATGWAPTRAFVEMIREMTLEDLAAETALAAQV
jgi:GDPmannose 4,6-dehydratase